MLFSFTIYIKYVKQFRSHVLIMRMSIVPSEANQPTQNNIVAWGFRTVVLISMLVY
jgi:hypothetical protein